jgi:putative transposase
MRKINLTTGEIFHIVSRSIAGFKIFNNNRDYERFIKAIQFYNCQQSNIKLSDFLILSSKKQTEIKQRFLMDSDTQLSQIIAYCIMPTHIHLVLKQLIDNGISKFMMKLLDSYTRYFNLKHQRKGPLWESRFKNVLVEDDEQLLHLTRYIHLNPTSANLINEPEDWNYSSYGEYLLKDIKNKICTFNNILDIEPHSYQEYVNDRKNFQKELSKIKKLLIENYYG